MTKFFYWNESYEIGVPVIDEQHQQLVNLINNLGAALDMQVEMPKIQSLISELRNYIEFHFRDEERLFSKSTMPQKAQDEHKKVHRSFVQKIDNVFSEKHLNDEMAAQEIFDFLVTWLINHILGVDTSLTQYLTDSPEQSSEIDDNTLLELGGNQITRTLIHALNESEKRFRLLSDNAPVLIWISDIQGKRIFANKAWSHLLGEDVKASSLLWFENIHPNDRNAYIKHQDLMIDDPSPSDFEYRFKNKEGEYRYLLERSVPRLEKSGAFMGLIASTVDITSLKKAEKLLLQTNEDLEVEVEKRTEELRNLMLTDTLTNTKNRRFLMEALDNETKRSERYGSNLSTIFIDIDHFKKVNDDFGHLVGDKVLIQVAKIMSEKLRSCDQLCRYGGEEFVILLPESDLACAKLIADRILSAIRSTVIPELDKSVTVSAGIGQWQKGENGQDLLDRCDQALYVAKDSGRDQFQLAA